MFIVTFEIVWKKQISFTILNQIFELVTELYNSLNAILLRLTCIVSYFK